jgi:predicted O-methyltransferase YrrM
MKATFLRKLRLLSAYPRAVAQRPRAALRYLFRDREFTNLTYEIANEDELVRFVAATLGRPLEEIAAFVAEPRTDDRLLLPLRGTLAERSDRNDEPLFGRRLAWYALVRALKPALVVETGVHDGLGSALLLRALELNGTGRLIGLDVDPASGWLVPADARTRYELVIGDVRETLPATLEGLSVDLFIHDSLHTYEHELFELRLALERGADDVVLVSDNAHATSALSDVCVEHGLSFALFLERPRGHFYPGAGVGVGLRPR